MAGPWEDYAPAAKRDSGPWDDYGPEASRSLTDKLTAPFRYGTSQAAKGLQATLHETGNDGATSDVAGGIASAAAPENYTPAHVTLNPATWGDIPKAVAESAPGMAADIPAGMAGASLGAMTGPLAPVLAPLGGVLGAGASYALRNYGRDARSAAVSRGGDDTSELTAGDKARALLMSGIGGVTSRLSLGALGSPVKAEAGSVASQLIPQVAKGAGIDAATGVGQEAAHQGIIDQKFDPSALGGALVTGAATGVAMRGAAGVKDAVAAGKFSDIGEHGQPVANRLLEVDSPHKAGSPEDSYYRVKKTEDDLGLEAQSALSNPQMKERLAALREVNPNDPTAETIKRVQKDIAEGRRPAADDLELIKNRVGDVDTGGNRLPDILGQHDTLNQVKSAGNMDTANETLSGGLSSTPFAKNVLSPMGKIGAAADLGAVLYAATGHTLPGLSAMHALADPVSAAAIPASQAGVYATLRAIDALTGSRNPVQQFTNRFSGEPTAPQPGAPGSPPQGAGGPPTGASLVAGLAAAKAAAASAKQAGSAPSPIDTVARQVKMMASSQRLAERQQAAQAASEAATAAAPLNAAAKQVKMMSVSQRLEEARRRQADRKQAAADKAEAATKEEPLNAAARQVKLMVNSQKLAEKQSSDAMGAVGNQVKMQGNSQKLEERQQAKADRQDAQQTKADAKSTSDEAKARDKAAVDAAKKLVAEQKLTDKANGKSNGSKLAASKDAKGSVHGVEPPPGTTRIVHEHGVRDQVIGDIKRNRSSVENGVATRADARGEIMKATSELPLSAAGHAYIAANMPQILTQSFHAKTPHAARGLIEGHLDHLTSSDAQTVRDHLRNATDNSGRTYYGTWE